MHNDATDITVVERDRMGVFPIYWTCWGFDSGHASQNFGSIFQNSGAGFTLTSGNPNESAPGSRPIHAIIAAMLKRACRVIMHFGIMGGGHQPCGPARLVTNQVDCGLDQQAAVVARRGFAGPEGMQAAGDCADAVRAELAQMGHAVSIPAQPLGGVQNKLIDDSGILIRASNPRRHGRTIG